MDNQNSLSAAIYTKETLNTLKQQGDNFYESTFAYDYKPYEVVPIVKTMLDQPSGTRHVLDNINDGFHNTETADEFIDHGVIKHGPEYDENAQRKTNFKMSSDYSKIPFAESNYDVSFKPKYNFTYKKRKPARDSLTLGSMKNIILPKSIYKENFTMHDLNKNKLVKSYSRHYDSSIIRDDNRSFDVTSQEFFPPYVPFPRHPKPIYPPTGTSVPLGDKENVRPVPSTMRESYQSPPHTNNTPDNEWKKKVRESCVMTKRNTPDTRHYTTVTKNDYEHLPGKPSEVAKIDQNKSSIPEGDEDAERNTANMSTTTYDVEFIPDVHIGHSNKILQGSDFITKSNVYFSPKTLQGSYYESSNQSVHTALPLATTDKYFKSKFYKPSSVPVNYYNDSVHFDTTMSTDFNNSNVPKMEINEEKKRQVSESHIKAANEDRDFRTTMLDEFTEKTAERPEYDAHTSQRSSIPL